MVIPKEVYETVGGFDEKIFMYTEEMELAYRISQLGKKVVYDPDEQIIHLGGASGGNYLALTSEVQNIIYFWHKHMPAWQLPVAKFFILVGSLLRLLFFGIIRQNESSRKAYFECIKLSL
jgi:GT2 family glycosyltransferase